MFTSPFKRLFNGLLILSTSSMMASSALAHQEAPTYRYGNPYLSNYASKRAIQPTYPTHFTVKSSHIRKYNNAGSYNRQHYGNSHYGHSHNHSHNHRHNNRHHHRDGHYYDSRYDARYDSRHDYRRCDDYPRKRVRRDGSYISIQLGTPENRLSYYR